MSLVLTACVSAPGMTTAPPPSDPEPAALTPAAVTSPQPPAETSVRKPKDLLFIEFFAIT
jgi:hypothetical protein